MNEGQVKVWDIFIRTFHWVLVLTFVIAYVTEDDSMTLHSYAGYIMLALLLLRILYGFVGTRYARFSDFIYAPRTAVLYVKDVFLFRPKRYMGHNPAGGLMIIVMLLSLIATCITGMMALAVEENQGPFVEYISFFPVWFVSLSEDLHELLAHFSLFLVAIHLTGVIVESIVHGENLMMSMINGRKDQEVKN